MFDARSFALQMLSQNRSLIDNPKKQKWVDAIQNNDSKTGEQIATNLLNTYGVKREDVPKIAQQFFSGMIK